MHQVRDAHTATAQRELRWHRIWCFCVLGLTLTLTVSASADFFSDVFIFGDSLSDTGNIPARTFGFFPPDPPYFDGRFSDGPLWPEYLADQLNLVVVPNDSDPTVINGNNFAFGGAKAARDVPIFPFGVIPSVQNQVDLFMSAIGAAPSDALYVVWGGGNDLRFAAKPGNGLTFEQRYQVVQDAVDAIVGAVAALAGAGAQDVLVPNIPDLGATPEAILLGNVGEATLISVQFNIVLASELDTAADELGINIIQFDTFALLQDIIEDALNNDGMLFGITNIDTPIAPGLPDKPRSGSAAEVPIAALWADDVHPSTVTHEVFASAVLEALITSDPADLDGDGRVGASDLPILVGSWGPCEECPADLDGNGVVGTADLAILLRRRQEHQPGYDHRYLSFEP